MNQAQRQAQALLASNATTIDAQRHYSMGPNGAKTLLDEKDKARQVSLTITNSDTADKAIVFGVPRHTIFTDVDGTPRMADFLEAVGADFVLTDGILEVGAGDATLLEAVSNDSGRTIAQLMEHAAHAPLRLTEMNLQSSNATDNTPDSTAFTTSLKTVWVSPFKKPVEDTFSLRKLQTNKSTATQFGHIDFIGQQFPVILSRENFLVMIVKAKTALSLTIGAGVEDSAPQRMYRAIQKSDSLVGKMRAGESCDC